MKTNAPAAWLWISPASRSWPGDIYGSAPWWFALPLELNLTEEQARDFAPD